MGFESKILAAIEPIAPRKASFSCGQLTVVDVSKAEIDEIVVAIEEAIPFTPLNVRQLDTHEFAIDFDT